MIAVPYKQVVGATGGCLLGRVPHVDRAVVTVDSTNVIFSFPMACVSSGVDVSNLQP